jgi:hypothetical protein
MSLGLWVSSAAADDLWLARDRAWFATIIGAKWVDTRLPSLPYNAVTGKLRFTDAYLVSGSVSRVLLPNFAIPIPGTGTRLIGNSIELEAQLAEHFGKENTEEGVLAVAVRTGQIPLWSSGVAVNLAWANGLSYAFSRPAYEEGPGGARGVGSRQLQYYMGIESEWTAAAAPRIHFVSQLHHRSGVYGLISPQKTGSNYLGGGLRFDFD